MDGVDKVYRHIDANIAEHVDAPVHVYLCEAVPARRMAIKYESLDRCGFSLKVPVVAAEIWIRKFRVPVSRVATPKV